MKQETVRVYNDHVGYIDYIPGKKLPPYKLKCPQCRDVDLKWDGTRCTCGHKFPKVECMIPKCECGAGNNAPGHSHWCPRS